MGYSVAEDRPELVEKAKQNMDAFLELYDRNVTGLYRYAFYQTGNRDEAEDIVSQTFLQAREHLHRYEQRGIPFSHWLYRIASNLISRSQRRRQREMPLAAETLEVAAAGEDPGSVTERIDLGVLVRTLPERQQQALTLRYIQDLSLRDVAQIMDLSEGAVKQLAFRALRTLRERMGERE